MYVCPSPYAPRSVDLGDRGGPFCTVRHLAGRCPEASRHRDLEPGPCPAAPRRPSPASDPWCPGPCPPTPHTHNVDTCQPRGLGPSDRQRDQGQGGAPRAPRGMSHPFRYRYCSGASGTWHCAMVASPWQCYDLVTMLALGVVPGAGWPHDGISFHRTERSVQALGERDPRISGSPRADGQASRRRPPPAGPGDMAPTGSGAATRPVRTPWRGCGPGSPSSGRHRWGSSLS